MNQNFFILVLCLLLLAGTALSKDYKEDSAYLGDWQQGNHMRWAARPSDTIDIDDNQGDTVEGSTDYDSSGYPDDEYDDEDAEGSGAPTGCINLQRQMREEGSIGLYIPQCTEDGGFVPLQCHFSTLECWCVDSTGAEITGTKRKSRKETNCEHVMDDRTTPRMPVEGTRSRPGVRPRDPSTGIDSNDEISFTPDDNEPVDKFPSKPTGPEASVPGDNDKNTGEGRNHGVPAERVSLIMQPGILAGIIGGAVVGLLCTVLLMMFIVYRMRKKDEGSYALDDPKQKARDREFFA